MSDEDYIFSLEPVFNAPLLGIFFHGIYTCTLAVTLRAIASNKERLTKARIAMVSIIIILYISTSVYVAIEWSFTQYTFVKNGETFVTTWNAWTSGTSTPWLVYHWSSGFTSGLTTSIADAIMIWRCWVIWGGRYEVITLPTLLLSSQNVFGWLTLLANIHLDTSDDPSKVEMEQIQWLTVYLSLSLGTTLFCTILIIYRIIRVGRSSDNVGAYRRVIEIVVESALLYAFSAILWMAFLLRDDLASPYPEAAYVSITGIAPTLIVGRVASGQARPNDSWKSRNTVSTIQFGGHSVAQSESVSAEERAVNNGHEIKPEVDGLERDGNRARDSVLGSGRRVTIDLERN
ncbi:hypothetical protein ARMGADRAFT_1165940 [Armillaria gallica]|uniref:Family A G protein-coupled receptor-like protein n=1 Tax=Armillaria gallica TaxID=47427 RepID=A0A2H3DVB9_ARMGA|nr:hypothetical protein ARMGADRAFT_1165940 [Armillaria gallica]